MYSEIRVIGLSGIPEISEGDDLSELIVEAAKRQETDLQARDILVVTQKIVSKAEGCVVNLRDIKPSMFAQSLGSCWGKDPRVAEIVLQESKRIVRMDHGVIISETKHGLICANAGVDLSNAPGEDWACLLPSDPDRSAEGIRQNIRLRTGLEVAVLISDTFGRPWRIGTTDVAIGVAGINPVKDYRGKRDSNGYELRVSVTAWADELTGAAELVSNKLDGVPVSVIRGIEYNVSSGSGADLKRDHASDLFR